MSTHRRVRRAVSAVHAGAAARRERGDAHGVRLGGADFLQLGVDAVQLGEDLPAGAVFAEVRRDVGAQRSLGHGGGDGGWSAVWETENARVQGPPRKKSARSPRGRAAVPGRTMPRQARPARRHSAARAAPAASPRARLCGGVAPPDLARGGGALGLLAPRGASSPPCPPRPATRPRRRRWPRRRAARRRRCRCRATRAARLQAAVALTRRRRSAAPTAWRLPARASARRAAAGAAWSSCTRSACGTTWRCVSYNAAAARHPAPLYLTRARAPARCRPAGQPPQRVQRVPRAV